MFINTCPDTGSSKTADFTSKPRDSTEGIEVAVCTVVVSVVVDSVEVDSVCSPSASAITGAREKHSRFSSNTEATLLRRKRRLVVDLRCGCLCFNALKLPSYSFICFIYSITGVPAKKDKQDGKRPA
ncbi:hypothetical protein D3C81_1307400 [compost metagenome]